MSQTNLLAEFASRLSLDGVPRETVERLKLHLIDSLGCNVYGASLEHCQQMMAVLDQFGGKPTARVFGTDVVTSSYNAALANGMMTQGFESDDVGVYCHPGSCLIPATVAASEHIGGVDGATFLAALLAGYEVTIRVAESTGLYPESNIGWHTPGFHGAIGAAVAAGRVFNFDTALMHRAIGIAADIAGGGLFSARPTAAASKRMHSGRAAATGILAALAAKEGITGVPGVLEYEPWGYCWAMSGYSGEGEKQWNLDALTDGLGSQFISMERVSFKSYPTVAFNGTIMENARRIRNENDFDPDDIERVEVRMIKMHVWTAVKREVDDLASANFSSKYPVALGILYDAPPLYESSEALKIWRSAFRNPKVQEIITRTVEVLDEDKDAANPYSQDTAVTVFLKDGQELRARTDYNTGNPTVGTIKLGEMTPDRVRSKFVNMASEVVGIDRANNALGLLDELEAARSVDPLLQELVLG